MKTDSLEARIQRIEDRNAIIDLVVGYAVAIDEGDWTAFGAMLTDPVHIDFSEAGLPAADFPRDRFVGFASAALDGWTARQHISPNHRVVLDETDPDKATCFSYMYAQHYKKDAPGGDFYLMRGSYDTKLTRTAEGWKITSVTQHVSWLEGNPDAAQQPLPA